ncbi:DUF6479 family protein [Streptomyces sp. NPDC001380]|uniref:DUF6479 family protein n=1 Tax=Streptomyces sp. NPDC001380 TaxID=3364566 RepID=UPI0036A4C2A2
MEAAVVSDVKPAVVVIIVIGVLIVVALVAAFIAGYRRKQEEPPPPVSHGPGSESWETPEEHERHRRGAQQPGAPAGREQGRGRHREHDGPAH